jgi:hypothetical protein
MKVSSREIRNSIQNFLDYLVQSEIALIVNAVNDRGGRVTWRAPNTVDKEFFRQAEPTIAEYLGWVRSQAYSALLFDGALLQVTYDFVGDDLRGHRLAYIPCPFSLDLDLLRTEPILDVLELYEDQGSANVRLRASIRFDFDPDAQQLGHAAAHATLNAPHCRIPCVSALSLGHFVAFVFQHFYPEIWHVHEYLRVIPKQRLVTRSIIEAEEGLLHFAWRG